MKTLQVTSKNKTVQQNKQYLKNICISIDYQLNKFLKKQGHLIYFV